MWQQKWIGLRYQALGRGPDAYDCLGLFLALHSARFNRVLPDPRCSMSAAARRGVAEGMRPQVSPVSFSEVQEGDALMFRVRGQLLHVGYALDRVSMLHIEEDAVGSVIEDWTRPKWQSRLEGVYRFV